MNAKQGQPQFSKVNKDSRINSKNQPSYYIMMNSAGIREKFLEFFRSKEHFIVPSAPIVIKDDPTLMFTNAGMNQFKDYFLGNKKSPKPRIADTQKCLRVSGKHNDLEEVGVDTYHHTMFEMLGNWSFGDHAHPESGYFKKEAIAWSWELLTEIYQIPKDRLYVTIFQGDEKEKLAQDEEALTEWKKWMPQDRILQGNKKDNFWEMGDTGPCGPCTEIHIDCRSEEERKKKEGKELVNSDHPQVIEIWNIVFIQYNRLKDGTLQPLPAKHVDTGMGLERLARILQNKNSNYDTDIFTGTIAATEKITGKKYTGDESKQAVSFRVIADHIRAIAFTMADGQLPSNTGAGYVIRRILRRAVRYYYSYLDYNRPLLNQLIPALAEQFKNVFPELEKQKEFVVKVIKEEEHNFLKTLDAGLQTLEQISSSVTTTTTRRIAGDVAFELYDTFGFPLDLTNLIASEKQLTVDEAGFEIEMKKQKQRSRSAASIETEDWIVLDDFALNSFVGYDSLEIKTKVVKYRKVKAKGKESYQLVLETTPFYAESGGQVGDTGHLEFNGKIVQVTDTKKDNDLIIHFIDELPGVLNGSVLAKVNIERRERIALHHTATHLLHAALRRILGVHVTQKGSLVNDEHFRFDFSHFAKMTDEEIAKVNALVNEMIRKDIPVVTKEMPKDEALAMGAMALFGEKYGEVVRVVIIDPKYSVELCGGTHVGSTGEIGFFRITHETAVAAGVRRVEAVGGKMAEIFIGEQLALIKGIQESLKNPKELQKAVENIINENAELRKKLEKLETRQLADIKNELVKMAESVNGYFFIGKIVEVNNPDALKKLCFDLKNDTPNSTIVLAASIDNKAYVAILLDEKVAAEKNLDASRIVKEQIAPLIKGGGGGQKTLATAGGQDTSKLEQVIQKVKSLL